MSFVSFLLRRLTLNRKFSETGTARTLKSKKNSANILEITGLDGLKKGDFVTAGQSKAWVYALYQDYSLAAVLSDSSYSYNGPVVPDKSFDLFFNKSSAPGKYPLFPSSGESFKKFISTPPPYVHSPYNSQILTGYHQLDICQPISMGQCLVFYGASNKGKSTLAYQIAQKFSMEPQTKVVIASPNPAKSRPVIENAIEYCSSSEYSEVSQYFLPFIALAHACSLRDEGYNVLFILDDSLFHTFKEKSLFSTEKILNSNIGSLVFEQSKNLSKNKSLTSIILIDENYTEEARLLTKGLTAHLLSLASQSFNFQSSHPIIEKSRPVLDFVQPYLTNFPYQMPIMKKLRENLMRLFKKLKDLQDTELARQKLGVKSDPWEIYFLLDSKYYLALLCQNTQYSSVELICFIQFTIHCIEHEKISQFNLEMAELRNEFLKFIKTCSSKGLADLMKDPYSANVEETLKDLEENVIKHFFVEAKIQGWLKDYQDDYEDLFVSSSASSKTVLKTEVKPEEKPFIKGIFDNIFKIS